MIKINYLYFLCLLCLVNNITVSMHPKGSELHRNEKIYFQNYNEKIFFPIVQLTHQINLCFHNAFLFAETNPTLRRSKNVITECCGHMENLTTIIANDFDVFQRNKLKKIF